MGKIILLLLLPLFSFSQKVNLKLNIVEWRFNELGNIIIDNNLALSFEFDKNGKIECVESQRIFLLEWILDFIELKN